MTAILSVAAAQLFPPCAKIVTIPNNTLTIPNKTYYNCTDLERVIFQDGATLKEIGRQAFDKTGITDLKLPQSLERIGKLAFYSTDALKKVSIPSGSKLTLIDAGAFRISGITSIDMPASVETIGTSAFWQSGLESIEIPNAMKIIGPFAFYGSPLERILFKAENDTRYKNSSGLAIGTKAFARTMISRIDIPYKVSSIAKDAFWDCKNLTDVSFTSPPKGVQVEGFDCRTIAISSAQSVTCLRHTGVRNPGHNYTGHNDTGHTYIGHSYMGHNCIGHRGDGSPLRLS